MSTAPLQVLSISAAFMASGGIATLSLFDVPIIQSQPASRSLPSIRWLFSRGSHIFPTAALVSSTGFAYLAYESLSEKYISLSNFLNGTSGYYAAAAVFTFGIAPFTMLFMGDPNFILIRKNEEKGGTGSRKSERQTATQLKSRTAKDSIDGKGDVNQFTDLSGPQEKTIEETDEEEDREVGELLAKFGRLNTVRAVLMSIGGVLGLLGALRR